jgi:N6-adenosine-specific RNA methylase IME4
MKKYKTIVADPPWKYGKWGKASVPNYEGHIPKESDIPYDTMSVEEIKSLNVAILADDNCELYLWTTQKYNN